MIFSAGIEGAPEVSAAFGTAQLIISSTVANPTIGFAAGSLQAAVSSDGIPESQQVTDDMAMVMLSPGAR